MKTLKYRIHSKSFCLWTCLVALFFCVSSCKDDADVNKPLVEGGNAPGQVTDIEVENTSGGAILTYTPPSDQNLAYVQAVVNVPGGKVYEYKASPYNARIEIIGLGSADPQEVKLYSVSRSEKRSEPVSVTIHPLDPPYIGVYKSMELTEDFGGVNVKFENISEAELALTLCVKNDKGEMEEVDTYFTEAKEGNFTWRGMDPIEKDFGVYIRDRWDNFSDTLYAKLTPLFEEELDKNKFRDLTLPGDAKIYTTEWNIAKVFLWNGTYGKEFAADGCYGDWLNMSTEGMVTNDPLWITIDLGQTAQLSRLRLNHYYTYQNKAPRRYEIWGCTNEPPLDGSWDNWYKMAEHEQIKPSGLPVGSYGPGDEENWLAGDNITFSKDLPKTRYIRIKCLENWKGDTHMSIAEVTFYGSVVGN